MKNIKIIIDNDILEKYKCEYFKKYPKRKKFPIEKPIPPSLNVWMIMRRHQMNHNKQVWKEFGIWLVEYNNLNNMNIEKCNIMVQYFFDSKRKHDADNFTPKNIFDAFTSAGLLMDDDFEVIESLTIKGGYSKCNPRIEITIFYQEENNG